MAMATNPREGTRETAQLVPWTVPGSYRGEGAQRRRSEPKPCYRDKHKEARRAITQGESSVFLCLANRVACTAMVASTPVNDWKGQRATRNGPWPCPNRAATVARSSGIRRHTRPDSLAWTARALAAARFPC